MNKRPRTLLLPVQIASFVFSGHLFAQSQAVNPSKVGSPELGATGGAAPARAAPSPSSQPSLPVFGVSVDRTSVSIGDPVTVTYSARIPVGTSIRLESLVTPELPEGERPPTGAVLEFLDAKPPDIEKWEGKEGEALWKQTVTFIPFMAGTVTVPGPYFTFEEKQPDGMPGRQQSLRPPSVTLQVDSRLPKDAKPDALAPKDDRPVRLPAPSLLFWGGVAALVLLLLAGAWWWIRRRRLAKVAGEEIAPAVPPGVELLAELDRLAREAEALGDDPRAFYAGLTYAVKRYLERRLAEPILEWTSFETVRRLREKGIDVPKETGLAELLSAADLVKFGRGRSTRQAALDHVSRARRLRDVLEAHLAPAPPAEAAETTEKAS